MRYAFGLVSLLVVTAIIMWLFAKYEIPVARKRKGRSGAGPADHRQDGRRHRRAGLGEG